MEVEATCRKLLANGLFESVHTLLSFHGPRSSSETAFLFAETLVLRNEPRRALAYYSRALDLRTESSKTTEAETRYKYASTCVQVGEYANARLVVVFLTFSLRPGLTGFYQLEGLATQRRDVRSCRLLVEIYELSGEQWYDIKEELLKKRLK